MLSQRVWDAVRELGERDGRSTSQVIGGLVFAAMGGATRERVMRHLARR
jgi:hypothetical protein